MQAQLDKVQKLFTDKDSLLTEALQQRDEARTQRDQYKEFWTQSEARLQSLLGRLDPLTQLLVTSTAEVSTSISESKTIGMQIGTFLDWAQVQDQTQKKTISDLRTENIIHWIADAILVGATVAGWARK